MYVCLLFDTRQGTYFCGEKYCNFYWHGEHRNFIANIDDNLSDWRSFLSQYRIGGR